APFHREIRLVPDLVVPNPPSVARNDCVDVIAKIDQVIRRRRDMGISQSRPFWRGVQSNDQLQSEPIGLGHNLVVLLPGALPELPDEASLLIGLDICPWELLAHPME